MSPFEVEALQEVLVSLIVASTVIVGGILFLKFRAQRAASLSEGQMNRLLESTEALVGSVEDMRQEITEMHDRLEFTERLLAKVVEKSDPGQLPRGGE